MNLEFNLNEYLLIWNILFRQSISKELNHQKQKVWVNYKDEYNELANENEIILKDPRNYIPSDDTIYNIVKELEIYEEIYRSTERYKMALIQTFNDYKKELAREFDDIVRISFPDYEILVVHPRLNLLDYGRGEDESFRIICYGKRKDNLLDIIIDLFFRILKREIVNYNAECQEVVNAVLELCILHELPTRIKGQSCYKNISPLKRKIYPYFLQYLGVDPDNMDNYMKRDGIYFDKKLYPYNESLKSQNLYDFIDFCLEYQGSIVASKKIEVI